MCWLYMITLGDLKDLSLGFRFNWSGSGFLAVGIFKSSLGDFSVQSGLRTIALHLVNTGQIQL